MRPTYDVLRDAPALEKMRSPRLPQCRGDGGWSLSCYFLPKTAIASSRFAERSGTAKLVGAGYALPVKEVRTLSILPQLA
jgi:hypothetical protein